MYICSSPAPLQKLGEIWNAILGNYKIIICSIVLGTAVQYEQVFFPSLERVFRLTFKTAGTGVSGPSPHLHCHICMSNVLRKTLSRKCEKPFMYKSCIHSKGERWMNLGQYNSIISVSQQPKISVGFLRLSAANSAKIFFSQLVKICY